jgi:hypothetical protein
MDVQSMDTVLFDDCAFRGRLAVGIAQELRSCGTPRGQSGDHPTRQSARGVVFQTWI